MMNQYQDSINNFIAEYKLKGIERVIIQSGLDIAFLFESACDKNEINYVKYTISEIIERNSTNKKSLIIVEDEKDASSIKNLINKNSACCSIIEIMGILG
ncbi:MAG: hypothetical protein GX285_04010 [Clostridiales bacterium]|nr:hypothetical protein [Clostridiales bacterium]